MEKHEDHTDVLQSTNSWKYIVLILNILPHQKITETANISNNSRDVNWKCWPPNNFGHSNFEVQNFKILVLTLRLSLSRTYSTSTDSSTVMCREKFHTFLVWILLSVSAWLHISQLVVLMYITDKYWHQNDKYGHHEKSKFSP